MDVKVGPCPKAWTETRVADMGFIQNDEKIVDRSENKYQGPNNGKFLC